jgi:hypothetical protein
MDLSVSSLSPLCLFFVNQSLLILVGMQNVRTDPLFSSLIHRRSGHNPELLHGDAELLHGDAEQFGEAMLARRLIWWEQDFVGGRQWRCGFYFHLLEPLGGMLIETRIPVWKCVSNFACFLHQCGAVPCRHTVKKGFISSQSGGLSIF